MSVHFTKNILFLLFCCLSIASTAQYSFDTIQVKTAAVPLKINETGRNITVITAEQIQALPATSLDEILQSVTGVEVQSRGGFGVQGDILMRGSTFTQVMILVDGMKVNDPLTGHFNAYIPVTPAEIERIEILRGAAAAMYGADAVGGVINIITKTFSDVEEGVSLSGELNYGDHKLVNATQGFTVRKGASTFSGGFAMNQSEGEFFPERVIDTSTTLTSYNNFFDVKTVGASFAHRFDKGWSLRARTSYDFRDFGARYFYTSSIFDKSEETVTNWYNHLQIAKRAYASSTDINIAYKRNTDVFAFSPDFPSTNNHLTQFLNFTVNHLQFITNDITFKTGIQADQRKIESNDRGDHEDIHLGVYATGAYQNDALNVSLSLRGDYDENYEFEFTPQLNVSYVLPRVVLRASAGRSIRAADYTERYVSNNLMDLTPGRSLGNPNLLAENSWSEEIGVDYALTRNWQLKLTAFARQSSNLIDYVPTNEAEIGTISDIGSLREGADYFFASNITDVNTNGIEFESALFHDLGAARLQWNLGYTYLNTTNEEDIVSVYISSHARHLVTTQLTLTANRFELGVTGLYKQRNERIASAIASTLEKDYMVWNARMGVRLTDNFGVNLQLQNVFNEQYQNILGAQMPSRWFMGGLKWSL